jgi:hypothetical protein
MLNPPPYKSKPPKRRSLKYVNKDGKHIALSLEKTESKKILELTGEYI